MSHQYGNRNRKFALDIGDGNIDQRQTKDEGGLSSKFISRPTRAFVSFSVMTVDQKKTLERKEKTNRRRTHFYFSYDHPG